MRIPRRSVSLAAAVAAVGLIAAGCGDDGNSAEDALGSATSAVGSVAESVGSQAQSAVESITADDDATGTPEGSEPAADQSSAVPGPGGGTVELSGPILAKYNEAGGADSDLGAATGNQEDVDDGNVAEFDGGIIAWSPDTDAHIVWGEIRVAWEAAGGAGGDLGFPISDEEPSAGGFRSNFESGYITYIDGATEVVQE